MSDSVEAELDWQNAPKADCVRVHELLSYLSGSVLDYDYLVRSVAALIAAEREACAKVASEWHDEGGGTAWGKSAETAADEIGQAIRKRAAAGESSDAASRQ